jgi:outer membrane protein assembly factor BamB
VSRKTGGATFSVTWPAPSDSRVIPVASNSIKITLFKGGNVLGTRVLARPAAGQPPTVTTGFDNLESGNDYSALAEAFPSADGTGVAQARAQVGFAVQDNVRTPVKLTMGLTIATLQITPSNIGKVGVGRQLRLFVNGLDANGNIVLTTLNTVNVTSGNTSLVTVTPDGSTAADATDFLVDVIAPPPGDVPTAVTITATDTESGKTAQVTLTVVPVGLNQFAPVPKFRVDAGNSGNETALNGPTGDIATPPTAFPAFGTGDEILLASPAIGADGTVYVGSTDGRLYAYDSAGGSVRWSVDTGGPIDSSPAIARDGGVFIGSESGKLTCVEPDGTVRYSIDLGAGPIDTPVAIGPDGSVYVGTSNGAASEFIAIDGLSGQVLWRYDNAGGDIRTVPAILQGAAPGDVTVFFATTGGEVVALASKPDASGNPVVRGTFSVADVGDTGTFYTSSPALSADGSTLYIGALNNNLYALNTADLSQKWAFDTGAPVYASPAVDLATGRVYVANFDTFGTSAVSFQSRLWALLPDGSADLSFGELDPSSGARTGYFLPQETSDTNSAEVVGTLITSSPLVDASGTVYFGAYNDRIYAVDGIDGSRLWAVKLGGADDTIANDIDSSPAIGPDGALYIGCVDGNVYQVAGGIGTRNGRSVRRGTGYHVRTGVTPTRSAASVGYRVPNFRVRR